LIENKDQNTKNKLIKIKIKTPKIVTEDFSQVNIKKPNENFIFKEAYDQTIDRDSNLMIDSDFIK